MEETKSDELNMLKERFESFLTALYDECSGADKTFYDTLSPLSEYGVMGLIVGKCREAEEGEESEHIEKMISNTGELVPEKRVVPSPTLIPFIQEQDGCSECLQKAFREGKLEIHY